MHPDGYLLVTGELDSSLMTFSYDTSSGEARYVASVPASEMASGSANAPSELALGPSDRYCYVANRGPNSISVFSLQDGEARFVGEVPSGGQWPRHIKVIDEYLYVANQESDAVSTFLLDPSTGLPQFRSTIHVPRPYCILAAD
jgi:6-phosphogluconolactonase (cycloisomerase 2 family)